LRAPGIAAIALGAVIALSATLGVTYRSEAATLDDPVTSVASDSSSPAADAPTPDASTPAASDDATTPTADDSATPSDSAIPSDSATPSDSSTPSGSPSPSDSPSPSSSAAFQWGSRSLFVSDFASGGPAPEVSFAFPHERSIDPTVTLTGGADQLSMSYVAVDFGGNPTGDPSVSFNSNSAATGPLDYGSTFVDGPGLWQFTVTQSWSDNSFEPTSTSTYFYVPDPPVLDYMSASEGVSFSGYGVQGDQIEVVSGNPNTSPPDFTVVCGGDSDYPIDYSSGGYWSCNASSALDLTATYWAIQVDANSDCNGSDGGCDVSPYAGGALSPDSSPITYYPSVDFEPRPAGSHLVANPGAGSHGTNAYYSMWQTFTGEGGPYDAWGSFEGQPSCDAGEGTISGTNTCDAIGLTPGYYAYDVYQDATDADLYRYFTVPSTPTLAVAPDGTGTAALHGSVADTPVDSVGDAVHVVVDGKSPACDGSTVANNGTWTCTITGLTGGTHTFQAYVEDTLASDGLGGYDHLEGGLSAGSGLVSATVVGSRSTTATTTTPTPTPTATDFSNWFFSITGVDLNNVHPGDKFTVTGTGLPPGSTVSGELHSKAVSIGSAVVQPDGSFTLPVVVPADFPAGAHTIVMTLTPAGGVPFVSQQPLKVVPAASDNNSPTPTPSDSPSPLGSSPGPGIDHHGPNSNILTHGLDSIADVISHPAKIPAALEIGLVLLIFAVLPGHLLNATLAEQYERFNARRPKRRRTAAPWWTRLAAFLGRAPFLAGVALTTVTALLFGFADPRFGFSIASLRLFLGLAIALAIVSYVVNVIVGRLMRGRWKVDVEVNLRPLGLILTVVGVVVSRVLDFSPGFLIGLVLGLVISEKHLAKHAWRAVLLRTGLLLTLALLAWLAFSLFDAKEEGGTFASELAVETLVAITTEAVVGLLVELLPLRLLEGEKLYQKSKILWGALYLVAIFIFVVAVVPWEGNWATLGSSLWTWIGIVVGFGILATSIYIFFRVRSRDEVEHDIDKDEDDDELVPISSDDDER
jgi:MFS family permease